MDNVSVYDHPRSVYEYAKSVYLDKPELTIIHRFTDRLRSWKMLDIGVGAGRTTYYFAPLVSEYTGIDYSASMIEACKQKYDARLEVQDVRDLGTYKDAYFDFVLFSFNGIDNILHSDRLKALKEIKRVLKKGGYFFFSSHNLQSIDRLFTFKLSVMPGDIYRNIFNTMVRLKNGPCERLKKLKHCTLYDGAHGFKIYNYYIRPKEQIKQLKEAGFKNIKIFSLKDGFEIDDDLEQASDPWLHYLCEK